MATRVIRTSVLAAGMLTMLVQRAEAEDAAKTGLLAGLGVAAATGKTSLDGGAGAIEASLLAADAFEQAAGIIKGVVAIKAPNRRVVILTRDQQIDLIAPDQLKDQLQQSKDFLQRECQTAVLIDNKEKEEIKKRNAARPGETAPQPFLDGIAIPDLVGVYSTDVAIGGIALSADDRRLVNALLLPSTAAGSGWLRWPGAADEETKERAKNDVIQFRLISEPAALVAKPPADTVAAAFNDFSSMLRDQRKNCPLERGAKAVAFADDLRKSLIDTSKGISPLATAIQLEAAGSNPRVLRIAVEQIGGTAIARSGVIYTFGWPNAATVSAGLLVSFRLIDPAQPGTITQGEIRCLTPQINIKHVRNMLEHDPSKRVKTPEPVICDYRTS